ncbi:MAG: heparinase II/III family protein [Planctomycetes bacterium]|nr:heparinase II/III family protein [Planctomycetota bacterium]
MRRERVVTARRGKAWILALGLGLGMGLGYSPEEVCAQEARPRPRLLFTARPVAGVPSLDEVRARAAEAPWRARVGDLDGNVANLALRWRLTGDAAVAARAVDALLELAPEEGYGLDYQGALLYLPLGYDWLHEKLTPPQRVQVADRIARQAEACRAFLQGPEEHIFHTSAYRAAMGLGLAAVALWGERPAAVEWLRACQDQLERSLFPACRYLDGAGVAGMSYSMGDAFPPLLLLQWALKSGLGLDTFQKNRDWLTSRLQYLRYSTLPDHTFVRWGDIVGGSRASTRDEARLVVDLLSRALERADGRAFAAEIAKRWQNQGYHSAVLYLGFLFGAAAPEAPPPALPLCRLFGKASVGQAFLRSGWGEGDTVVFVKCGDYFDDHGHFDQGSFTIFRKGHLAIDAGCYGDFNADHRLRFARHSMAHNTLLIGRPGEPLARWCQRVVKSQDSQDLEDYQRKKKRLSLETGEVLAFEDRGEWSYLAADLTPAYDPSVVRLATREFVFLRGTHLVLFDRVDAPGARARWLLHGAKRPEVAGTDFAVRGEASALAGRVLLPADASPRVVEEYRVDDAGFPPDGKGEFHVPGEGRVEVETAAPAAFLVVLAIGDAANGAGAGGAAGAALGADATLVRAEGQVGARVGGRTVWFRTSGAPRGVRVE